MNETKNAAPVVGHRSGGGMDCGEQFISPNFYSITPARSFQGISGLLGRGQGAAVKLKYLERATGKDNRTVRLLIRAERFDGHPICSDNWNGYFLPACELERTACVLSMRHRAQEILRAADAIERATL